jgi:hypothetical protein
MVFIDIYDARLADEKFPSEDIKAESEMVSDSVNVFREKDVGCVAGQHTLTSYRCPGFRPWRKNHD